MRSKNNVLQSAQPLLVYLMKIAMTLDMVMVVTDTIQGMAAMIMVTIMAVVIVLLMVHMVVVLAQVAVAERQAADHKDLQAQDKLDLLNHDKSLLARLQQKTHALKILSVIS